VDGQSEAGLVGGSAGNSAAGKRDVTAIFAEAIFPITDWAEIDGALRYDDYSDFGSATTWRLGGLMNIPSYDRLKFKASAGTGFRAPDLSSLYGATAFSADSAVDYLGCQIQGIGSADCPSRQFDTYIGSNPFLDAEESETWSVGVEWQFAERWMASLSYFDLTMSDPILNTRAQFQLDQDFLSNGNNPNVSRNSAGQVREIQAGWVNLPDDYNYSSVDMALSGGFDTGWGDWGLQANASYYINYDTFSIDGIYNAAGDLGVPEWRMNMLFTWALGDIFASANWDYIGEQNQIGGDDSYDAWNHWNMQAGYTFGKYGTVTIGANNIFDEDPILDSVVGAPVDESLYPNIGRVFFVSYRVDM
jgi:iron complex outermembrane receptor protein